MPIVALIVVMLLVVALVNLLKPSDRTSLTAGLDGAAVTGLAPSTLANVGGAENAGNTGSDTAPAVLPSATAIPTTAPVTLPDLAPAVEPVDADDRGSRADVSAGAAIATPTTEAAVPAPPPTTEVPATATPIPVQADDVAPAPTTPVPDPTAAPEPTTAPTPLPTATPRPEPTATPPPQPTATPLPVGVPPIQATPTAAPAPTTAVLSSNAEMELFVFAAINDVRARAGLAPVQLREDLSVIARDWSAQMAGAGAISHRPQAQLNAMLPAGWRAWAENVAEAPSVQWAQSALEQSPGHYQNMVGQYNVVGVGVVVAPSGQVFVTHNFAQY